MVRIRFLKKPILSLARPSLDWKAKLMGYVCISYVSPERQVSKASIE